MSDEAIPKLGLSLGQQIYTPTDTQTPLDQPADRPYAAWLYTGFTFQNYYPSSPEDPYARLSTIEFQFGAAGGDWALGEYVQNNYHKLIKVETAKGWSHQIDSEPGVNLVYEQKWRWSTAGARTGLGADLIPHAGFSLGNVFTYANTGAAFRLGYALPSDFGTNLIRPSGDSNATRRAPFGIWLFCQVDGRAVARDITLDGNTFSGGPSIEKQAFVADLGGGMHVNRKQLGDAALQEQRHRLAALAPQPMGDAVTLQRMEAFVEEEGIDIGVAGGIALEHRRQVGAHRRTQARVSGKGIIEHFADGQRAEIFAAQLAGQMIGQRLFQPLMLQDGGMDKPRQGWLSRAHRFGLLAQAAPDGIDG
jgi:hypothetical protein